MSSKPLRPAKAPTEEIIPADVQEEEEEEDAGDKQVAHVATKEEETATDKKDMQGKQLVNLIGQ